MIIDIGLAFLEGFILIISPCILPILPLILSTAMSGNKRRPFGVIIGFIISFAIFTFFSRKLVHYSGIDLNLIRHISYGILYMLGIIMLSNVLSEKFSQLTQPLTAVASKTSMQQKQGFYGGMLWGSLIAIIWTPCAGPILAAVIVQTVIQQTNLTSFLILIAFGIGVAIPMLAIALFGRQIMTEFTIFKQHSVTCRKILGVLIILSITYMVALESGYLSVLENSWKNLHTEADNGALELQDGLSQPYPAPPLAGITDWINSKPLQLNELKGKVVLLDFWTYSCINCIRTLPYLKSWYQKYHDHGFIIIGVHAPEFDFEKELNNVKNAVVLNKIAYPVALDNRFLTWRNFHNSYWPAHYLINKNGNVVYTHFGEGEYDITENNIRFLLGLTEATSENAAVANTFAWLETPETYLGYARANNFASPEPLARDAASSYTFPKKLSRNEWALQGNWKILADKIVAAQAHAAIKIHFRARKVFVVMGNATDHAILVKLRLNNQPIVNEPGKDVQNSSLTVNKHTLYEVISLPRGADGMLQVTAQAPGLELYTFTFGE